MIVLKALNKICIEHYANLYKMRPTIPRLWHILYQGRKTRAPRRLRFPTLHTASVHGFGKPIDVSPILFDASRLNLLGKPPKGLSEGLTSRLQESSRGISDQSPQITNRSRTRKTPPRTLPGKPGNLCIQSDVLVEGMTGWRAKIPSARGNKSACVSDSRRLVLEG